LYEHCQEKLIEEYLVQYVYLFKGTRLCVPRDRELLIREVHEEALAGPYKENMTTSMLKEHYYGPSMSKDVQDILKRYATC